MLNAVVTAGWFTALMSHVPFGDVYLHNPGRLRYLAMIALPVLGAVGIQGVRDQPISIRQARRWLAGGAVVLLVLPLAARGHPIRFVVLAVAMLAAIPALYGLATNRRRRATGLVLSVLAVELLASAIFANAYTGGTIYTGLETGDHPNLVPQVLEYPDLEASDFLRPTRFVELLRAQGDRYLTWAPPASNFEKGYLFAQRPQDWPALAMERGTLFGIDDALGYNPIQLVRYWTYIRAANPFSVFYNAAVLSRPTLEEIRLLGVRYLIVPRGVEPATVGGRVVATADDYQLIEVYGWEPRASVVPDWALVDDQTQALRGVLEQGFDPARRALLERDPRIEPSPGVVPTPGAYREVTPEDVRVEVEAVEPSIVVVRNSYDPGWTATVDGRPAPVIPTDYLVQGVPVPAGRHEVRLVYRDPDIARGLAASGAVWLSIALGIVVTAFTERRRARRVATPPEPRAGVAVP
jgi:hypothetical protein